MFIIRIAASKLLAAGSIVLLKTRTLQSIAAGVMMLVTAMYASVQAQDSELIQLRHQLALKYFEPEPHMALVKYFRDRGDSLQAFYLSEYARRGHFPEAQFDRAFAKVFGQRARRDEGGEAIFNKAIALHQSGNLNEAEENFIKAAALSPRTAEIQTWTGRFFYKVRKDDERALPYYLNAYFLDPHAYDGEFVEYRIQKINYEAATVRHRWLVQTGVSLAERLRDKNPAVAVVAIESLEGTWSPEVLELMLRCLDHDDEQVRWGATMTLARNVDRSFDSTLKALLQDKDLRKRGLAAYIAARSWKRESYPILQQMLREQAQLLRFDAISALAMDDSPEARRLLQQHRRSESHPTLLKLIDKTTKR